MFRSADAAQPLVDAELVYVCVDRSGAPVAWPQEMRGRMRDYEFTAPAEGDGRG
jgi:acyl-CoA thioesterase FadM